MPSGGAIIKFDNDYIEACFYAWYQVRGLTKNSVLKHIPYAPDGRKPDANTIISWREKFGWLERADALDAQLSAKLDKEAINKRAALIEQLVKDSRKMKDKGLAYLDKEDPFKDNPAAAIRAIVAGIEGEFKYTGMAQTLLAITKMDDKQLTKEALRLLGKNENEENTIDATFSEDVSSEEDGDSNSENDND